MTPEQARKIEEKLWYKAVSRYLDKSDWDMTEWLDDDEMEDYKKSREALGEPLI